MLPKNEAELSKITDILNKNDTPAVREVLDGYAINAAHTIGLLVSGGGSMISDAVRLAAAKDILDRSGYKPIDRTDVTSKGERLSSAPMTEEELETLINAYVKRTKPADSQKDIQ